MKVLITGGNGQLGRELFRVFSRENEVEAPGSRKLDITDWQMVRDFILCFNPELVIHSAALTAVDFCENNADRAYLVNALGTQGIAAACLRTGAELVYISTDYVFSGEKTEPYLEFDSPGPLNNYGKSKLAGEEYVRGLLDRYYIVRTAWLYGEGNNFLRTMLRLAGEKKSLEVVDDQLGSPTSCRELADVIYRLAATGLYGLYHATNNGCCSWYQYAHKIFSYLNFRVNLRPVNSSSFKRPAPRPAHSVLANFVLEKQGIYQMRPWEEALEEYLQTEGKRG